jgi:hypothetical protein
MYSHVLDEPVPRITAVPGYDWNVIVAATAPPLFTDNVTVSVDALTAVTTAPAPRLVPVANIPGTIPVVEVTTRVFAPLEPVALVLTDVGA